MLVGRMLGEAMNRIGQPSIMGQLLAGILLGPSALGWLWPDVQHWIFPAAREQKAMIDAISQFGMLPARARQSFFLDAGRDALIEKSAIFTDE